jgi:hypothetical protein
MDPYPDPAPCEPHPGGEAWGTQWPVGRNLGESHSDSNCPPIQLHLPTEMCLLTREITDLLLNTNVPFPTQKGAVPLCG